MIPEQKKPKRSKSFTDSYYDTGGEYAPILAPRALRKYGVCLISVPDLAPEDNEVKLWHKLVPYPHPKALLNNPKERGLGYSRAYFELDRKNRRVRYVGRRAWPTGRCSEWFYLG